MIVSCFLVKQLVFSISSKYRRSSIGKVRFRTQLERKECIRERFSVLVAGNTDYWPRRGKNLYLVMMKSSRINEELFWRIWRNFVVVGNPFVLIRRDDYLSDEYCLLFDQWSFWRTWAQRQCWNDSWKLKVVGWLVWRAEAAEEIGTFWKSCWGCSGGRQMLLQCTISSAPINWQQRDIARAAGRFCHRLNV